MCRLHGFPNQILEYGNLCCPLIGSSLQTTTCWRATQNAILLGKTKWQPLMTSDQELLTTNKPQVDRYVRLSGGQEIFFSMLGPKLSASKAQQNHVEIELKQLITGCRIETVLSLMNMKRKMWVNKNSPINSDLLYLPSLWYKNWDLDVVVGIDDVVNSCFRENLDS